MAIHTVTWNGDSQGNLFCTSCERYPEYVCLRNKQLFKGVLLKRARHLNTLQDLDQGDYIHLEALPLSVKLVTEALRQLSVVFKDFFHILYLICLTSNGNIGYKLFMIHIRLFRDMIFKQSILFNSVLPFRPVECRPVALLLVLSTILEHHLFVCHFSQFLTLSFLISQTPAMFFKLYIYLLF